MTLVEQINAVNDLLHGKRTPQEWTEDECELFIGIIPTFIVRPTRKGLSFTEITRIR